MRGSPANKAWTIEAMAVAAALAACGGGGLTTVGGTVAGLPAGTAVTLQINGRETLLVGSNGNFQFHDELNADQNYDVRVTGQPARASCTVGNGSGHIDRNASRVSDVSVLCVAAFNVGGNIVGLPASTTVTLSNGTDTATFSANGAFAFPTQLPTGASYTVTVAVQPVGHTCTVGNAVGTVPAIDVTSIVVSCS